jgi:Kef-type K+ transport system membrane component KefB
VTVSAPVEPLGGHALFLFFLQVAVLLVTALMLGRLATALAMPRLVGELFTGIVLGPSLLGGLIPNWSDWLFPPHPQQIHLLDAFGQAGVILLVGLTGVNVDLGLVQRKGSTAVRISLPGLLVPLVLGVGAGFLLPASLLPAGIDRSVFASFLGIALCVSAIPVIAKTLLDMRMLHRNVGQLILISGTVDDLLGWLGLSVVTAMATTGPTAGGLVRSAGSLLLFLCAVRLIGRPLVAGVMRAVTRSQEVETTIAAVVVVIVGLSAATSALGLEAVFGALVAGMLIKSAVPETRARLHAFRTFVMAVLAPVYFATVGLRVDLTVLSDPMVLGTAGILLALAIAGKFAGACIGSWASGLNRWETLAVAAGMNVRGVVGVIVASVGLRLGVLTTAMYTVVVLIAIVTSVMGPLILRIAVRRIELTAEERMRLAPEEESAAIWPRPPGGAASSDLFEDVKRYD